LQHILVAFEFILPLFVGLLNSSQVSLCFEATLAILGVCHGTSQMAFGFLGPSLDAVMTWTH